MKKTLFMLNKLFAATTIRAEVWNVEVGGGGGNGYYTLLFLLHPVGDGITIIHVADLVDQAGIKQNSFRSSRLASINVRGDADIARPLQRKLALRRIQRGVDGGYVTHFKRKFGQLRGIKTPRESLGARY